MIYLCIQKFIMNQYSKIFPFEKSFASHHKAHCWSDKNEKSARDTLLGTGKECWFVCDCGTEFCKPGYHISSSGSWCPCCSATQLCHKDGCVPCFNKSIASQLTDTITWSDKNYKPAISCGKSVKIPHWFYCSKCEHHFDTSPSHITQKQGCPYCAKSRLCDDSDCDHCKNRSFASHPRAEFWSDKNKLSPRDIFKSSHTKYLFNCNECKHEFVISPNMISHNNWCAYCASKILCDNIDCQTCHTNSFASYEMSKYWSEKNPISPRMIAIRSSKKFIFNCPHCKNEYINSPDCVFAGNWCPCTKNKTEALLYNYLITKYPHIAITKQQLFKWCKKSRTLPFDFCLPQHKIIIELDGIQHFKQVKNWPAPKTIQENDTYKMQCAISNNYSIIRLFQPDIWDNKNNWQSALHDAITKFTNIKKPSHIFIGDIYTTQYPTLTY